MSVIAIALIIAKESSKRLENKNWRDFAGKPMFIWNLLKCIALFEKTYVSSDYSFILNEAKKYGAIPIWRPKFLCGDIPSVEVFKHAIKKMNNPDAIISVQANSPTVDLKIIEKVKIMMETGHFQEVETCHENHSIYGSVWGITKDKLENYGDPYLRKPDAMIIDSSIDIHNIEDFNKALKEFNGN